MKKEDLYIVGQEAAIEFAEKNLSHERNTYLEILKRVIGFYDSEKIERYKPLVVEGYSETVEVFQFHWTENDANGYGPIPPYWRYDNRFIALRLIETGALLNPYESNFNSKKYGFSFVNDKNRRLRLCGFRFETPQHPNYVGVATRKKIEDWVEWLNERAAAQVEFARKGEEQNAKFLKALNERFPNAYKVVADDGRLVECRFSFGGIVYSYRLDDDGQWHRGVEVDYQSLVSTNELLGIE